jgi:hypothetical protein
MRTLLMPLVVVALLLAADALRAQETLDGAVTPATAHTPLGGDLPTAATKIHFEAAPTSVGDRVVQRIGMQMAVTTKIIQSGQVANESSSEIRRQQQRTIEVLEVADGRAAKARASFEVSRRVTPNDAGATEPITQPIEGKSYLVTRRGGELTVTDLEGRMPPLEEYKLASESLSGVGQPNPLAQLLAGQDVAVGQPMVVPRETASQLLGLNSPELAQVHRFELTLVRMSTPADATDAPLAVFRASIIMKPESDDALAVTLNGELAVEPATCRLASVDLAGPVHVTTIERTPLGMYQHSTAGELRVAIRSQFAAAQ